MSKIALPHWPRRMKAPLAAAYLGIGESKFLEKVADGYYPKPRRDGGNVLWDIQDLNRWVDVWKGSEKPLELDSF